MNYDTAFVCHYTTPIYTYEEAEQSQLERLLELDTAVNLSPKSEIGLQQQVTTGHLLSHYSSCFICRRPQK